MKRQIKSFKNAGKGIVSAFGSEPHLRFHFVAAFFVLLFAYIGKFDPSQWAILILTIGSVFAAELFNTALELLCDLYSTEHNPLIGKIKDIAAGAVLVSAVISVSVACALFIFNGKLTYIYHRVMAHPIFFLPFGICVVFSVLFILFGGQKTTKK